MNLKEINCKALIKYLDEFETHDEFKHWNCFLNKEYLNPNGNLVIEFTINRGRYIHKSGNEIILHTDNSIEFSLDSYFEEFEEDLILLITNYLRGIYNFEETTKKLNLKYIDSGNLIKFLNDNTDDITYNWHFVFESDEITSEKYTLYFNLDNAYYIRNNIISIDVNEDIEIGIDEPYEEGYDEVEIIVKKYLETLKNIDDNSIIKSENKNLLKEFNIIDFNNNCNCCIPYQIFNFSINVPIESGFIAKDLAALYCEKCGNIISIR